MRLSIALLALAFAGTPCASAAQTAAPVPAGPCTQPDTPGETVYAATPVMPALAAHYGIGGRVDVTIGLTPDGSVASAGVTSSNNVIFNNAAIEAARASRFAPAIRNCAPVLGPYRFRVEFERQGEVAPLVDPLAYFPGSWRCGTGAGARTVVWRRENNTLVADRNGVTSSVSQDPAYRIWSERLGSVAVGYAYPWVDPVWTWRYGSTTAQYQRLGDGVYTVTTGNPLQLAPSTTERCERT